MSLYEKFGWTVGIAEYLNDIRTVEASLSRADVGWYNDWYMTDRERNAAVCYFLLGDVSNCRRFAGRVVAHSLDYFYGSWRSELRTDDGTFDAGWWKRVSWISPFREASCFASCLEDWTEFKRLAEYPTDLCRPDPGCMREDKALYLALACFFRGEVGGDYERYYGTIDSGKKQKPKLLAEVLRAVQAINQSRFQRTLEEYFRYFRKSEFKKTSIDKLLSFDGTTLINVGRKQGLQFKIPPEVEDHII